MGAFSVQTFMWCYCLKGGEMCGRLLLTILTLPACHAFDASLSIDLALQVVNLMSPFQIFLEFCFYWDSHLILDILRSGTASASMQWSKTSRVVMAGDMGWCTSTKSQVIWKKLQLKMNSFSVNVQKVRCDKWKDSDKLSVPYSPDSMQTLPQPVDHDDGWIRLLRGK